MIQSKAAEAPLIIFVFFLFFEGIDVLIFIFIILLVVINAPGARGLTGTLH